MKKILKIIGIGLIELIVLWCIIFIIDYIRYKHDCKPIVQINDSQDGDMREYNGLGYKYIEYYLTYGRVTFLVPLWEKEGEWIKPASIGNITNYNPTAAMSLGGEALENYYITTAHECLDVIQKGDTNPNNATVTYSKTEDGYKYVDFNGETVFNENIKNEAIVEFTMDVDYMPQPYPIRVVFNADTREILGFEYVENRGPLD
ncbi:MAG: hypothetical protein FWF46_04440 [Oscillospiraceae bacterium]|nr:hypothetical protein [Oscillospiraceae bacterium]